MLALRPQNLGELLIDVESLIGPYNFARDGDGVEGLLQVAAPPSETGDFDETSLLRFGCGLVELADKLVANLVDLFSSAQPSEQAVASGQNLFRVAEAAGCNDERLVRLPKSWSLFTWSLQARQPSWPRGRTRQ